MKEDSDTYEKGTETGRGKDDTHRTSRESQVVGFGKEDPDTYKKVSEMGRVKDETHWTNRVGQVMGFGKGANSVLRDAVNAPASTPQSIAAAIENKAKVVRGRSALRNAVSRAWHFAGTGYGAGELYYKVVKPNSNTRPSENDSFSASNTKRNLQSNVTIKHSERALGKAIDKAIIQAVRDGGDREGVTEAVEKVREAVKEINSQRSGQSMSSRAQLQTRSRSSSMSR